MIGKRFGRGTWLVALALATVVACREAEQVPAASAAAFSGAGLHVDVSIDGGTAREGENEFRIRVRDASGAPVDDASAFLAYSMPMAGMATMGGRVDFQPVGRGEYVAIAALSMGGTWKLEIAASRPSGEVATAIGSLRTGAPGLELDAPSGGAEKPASAPASAEVRFDPARLQKIGIRFASAERGPLERIVRATGTVVWDETALVDVSLKVRGWVRELHADSLGARVEAGDPLFSVYSPEIYAAEAEYIEALRARSAAPNSAAGDRADAMVRAARARLRLWDVAESDIAALSARGEPRESVPIRARSSGFVLEKNVVLGGAIEPGMRLFRIAPLDRVWVDAQAFESDVALLRVGQAARVRGPTLPEGGIEARVAWVYPSLDAVARTARARLTLENPDFALRPGLWVEVELRIDLGERLHVPASAVIHSGARRVVFVDRGEGRLEPRDVEIGAAAGPSIEIVSGLVAGERVVSAGNFLIAAESRLQSALEQW